jgi:predicted esterase
VSSELLVVEARTHGRVLVRHAAAPPAGTLVGFHGYAETAGHQLERLTGLTGADGWTVVSIQGLHRFYRGRTDETVASWMTREDRLTAIADNIGYVNAAVAAAAPRVHEPLVFAGFSQGAAMAFRAAVHGSHRARAVVAVCGDVPPELLAGDAAFPEVLIVRGDADEWYTAARMDADLSALAARDVRVTGATVPGGHQWSAEVSDTVGKFLAGLTG